MSPEPKPKIHFVALVSVDYDIDLLPFFIPHYDALDLDNYCLFLHEGKKTDDNLWAEKAAKTAGWKSRFIPREASFNNGELKRVLLNKFRKAAKPADYVLCADGDEFQLWEDAPQEAVADNMDMVLGRRVDRFNDTLVPIEVDLPLEASYPLEHADLSRIIFPKHAPKRDKIVMAKAGLEVDYRKCDRLVGKAPPNLRVTGEVPIQHFKWRDGIFNRLQSRMDYTPEEIQAIKEFFEVKENAP